ncbi:MAG: hypothetical protein R3B96_24725 [Pirellulaceae bacterium]
MLPQLRNGVVAFHGGFHLRGVGDVPTWHDLMDVWTGPHALHKVYDAIAPTDVPFGQDCRVETSSSCAAESSTNSIPNWDISSRCPRILGRSCAAIEGTGDVLLDLEALDAFREDGEELEPGMLLHVDPPSLPTRPRMASPFRRCRARSGWSISSTTIAVSWNKPNANRLRLVHDPEHGESDSPFALHGDRRWVERLWLWLAW